MSSGNRESTTNLRIREALGIQDKIMTDDRYIPNEEIPYDFGAADLVYGDVS